MHPTPSNPAGPLSRLKVWIAALLGPRYAAAVATLDRAVAVFIVTFLTKAVGSGLFTVDHLTDLSYWQTTLLAGLAAALVVVQSALSTWLTGTPELLAPVSRTLRYRRDFGYRPAHHVPVQAPPRRDT